MNTDPVGLCPYKKKGNLATETDGTQGESCVDTQADGGAEEHQGWPVATRSQGQAGWSLLPASGGTSPGAPGSRPSSL